MPFNICMLFQVHCSKCICFCDDAYCFSVQSDCPWQLGLQSIHSCTCHGPPIPAGAASLEASCCHPRAPCSWPVARCGLEQGRWHTARGSSSTISLSPLAEHRGRSRHSPQTQGLSNPQLLGLYLQEEGNLLTWRLRPLFGPLACPHLHARQAESRSAPLSALPEGARVGMGPVRSGFVSWLPTLPAGLGLCCRLSSRHSAPSPLLLRGEDLSDVTPRSPGPLPPRACCMLPTASDSCLPNYPQCAQHMV